MITHVVAATEYLQPNSDGLPKRAMTSNLVGWPPLRGRTSNLIAMGLPLRAMGLQPNSDGLPPRAMSSNLIAMGLPVRAIASNLKAMASP